MTPLTGRVSQGPESPLYVKLILRLLLCHHSATFCSFWIQWGDSQDREKLLHPLLGILAIYVMKALPTEHLQEADILTSVKSFGSLCRCFLIRAMASSVLMIVWLPLSWQA